METTRPLSVTIAAVLLALASLVNVIIPLFPTELPGFVVYSGAALGVAGLFAAAGLWRLKRWSVVLTIVVALLNILSAAPGLFIAPTTALFVSAIVGCALFALILALVVLPTSLRSYA